MFRKISRAMCFFCDLLGLVYQHTDMNVLGASWWFAQISHLMIITIIHFFWHVVCINNFQIFSDKITQDNKKNLSECFLGANSVFSPYFEMTTLKKTSTSPLKIDRFFSDDNFRIYLDVFSLCFLLNGFYHGKPVPGDTGFSRCRLANLNDITEISLSSSASPVARALKAWVE